MTRVHPWPEPMTWHRWTTASAGVEFDDDGWNRGRGERRAGAELGLVVSGGRDTFDLVDEHDPTFRWEVKELSDAGSCAIRTGKIGTELAAEFFGDAREAVRQLRRLATLSLTAADSLALDGVVEFIEREAHRFTGVSFLTSDVMGARRTKNKPGRLGLRGAASVAGTALAHAMPLDDETVITVGPVVVSGPGRAATRAAATIAAKLDVAVKANIAMFAVDHPLAVDDRSVDHAWRRVGDPALAFPDVVGIVFVNRRRGFMVVPRERFNDVLRFNGINKMIPIFGVRPAFLPCQRERLSVRVNLLPH